MLSQHTTLWQEAGTALSGVWKQGRESLVRASPTEKPGQEPTHGTNSREEPQQTHSRAHTLVQPDVVRRPARRVVGPTATARRRAHAVFPEATKPSQTLLTASPHLKESLAGQERSARGLSAKP